MALRPLEHNNRRVGNKPRQLNEEEKRKIKKEQQKADYYRRNPHKKWGE